MGSLSVFREWIPRAGRPPRHNQDAPPPSRGEGGVDEWPSPRGVRGRTVETPQDTTCPRRSGQALYVVPLFSGCSVTRPYESKGWVEVGDLSFVVL